MVSPADNVGRGGDGAAAAADAAVLARRVAHREANRRRRALYTPSQRAAEQEKNRIRNAERRATGAYVRGPNTKRARTTAPAANTKAFTGSAGASRCPPAAVTQRTAAGPDCVDDVAAEAMDAELSLERMDPHRAEEIYARCRRALGYYGEGGELVCLVCQQLTLVRRCKVLLLRQLPLANMKARLAPAADLPQGLVADYDLSRTSPELSGMLLSPLGVVSCSKTKRRLDVRSDMVDADGESSCPSAGSDVAAGDAPRFVLCKTCHRSLRRPGKNMPKLSLANSNATGSLPSSIPALSRVEANLVALVAVKAGIMVLSGGRQRALKGHVYFYDIGSAPAASRLPRVVGDGAGDGVIRVVFAGHRTPAAVIASRRLVSARREVVSDVLNFLIANNAQYADVQVDDDALRRVSPAPEGGTLAGIFVGGDDNTSGDVDADICRARTDVAGERLTSSTDDARSNTSSDLSVSSSALVNVTPPATRQRESSAFENNFVVRRGGPIVPDRSAGTVTGCLPELYPYGRGGPDEKRVVHMSLAVYFKRMLLDGRRTFAQHMLFPLLAFDIVGRAAMMSRGALHVRLRPAIHAPIAGVSVAQLRDHLAGKERQRTSRRRGRRDVRRRADDPPALLMNEVYATMSRFPNSNEERGVWRQEVYAMCQLFGFPHVFFTITPDDVNSLTIMYYAGALDADVFFDGDCQSMPSRGARFQIVSKDPVADARYFGRMLGIVVRELLGWSDSEGRSVQGGGVFGVTKAFFGVVETQGRGALHAHNLVWVRGMPPTVERVKEAMVAHPAFKERFKLWAESYATASLPLSKSIVPCTVCGGAMKERATPESAQRAARKYAREPAVAECTVDGCGEQATATKILEVQGSAGVHLSVSSSDRQGESEVGSSDARPTGFSGGADWTTQHPVDAEKLALFSGSPVLAAWTWVSGYARGGLALVQSLLCRVQLHSWKHVDSCFKKGAAAKRGCCRYRFPRKPFEGGLDGGVYCAWRPLGCEYLNPFNLLLSVVCRCNVDVRVLFNDKARAVVYYIVKYATKAQHEVEPGTADVLAQFEKKLVAETAAGPAKIVDTATRRVLSIAYNSSSRMQVPAPLASMLVLGYPGRICSHKFGCLMLAQGMQRMEGEAICGVLRVRKQHRPVNGGGGQVRLHDGVASSAVGRSGTDGDIPRQPHGGIVREVVAVDSFTEYASRPSSLHDVCWYQYVAVWEQVKLPPSAVAASLAGDADDDAGASSGLSSSDGGRGARTAALRYLEQHPLYCTHAVKRRRRPCVPRLYGPRLPDRALLEDEDAQHTYGIVALLLFVPWRSRTDLVAEGESWWAAFSRTMFDEASTTQMDVMQSWFDAKNDADRAAAEAAAMGAGTGEAGSDSETEDRVEEASGLDDGDGVGDSGRVDFARASAVAVSDGVDVLDDPVQATREPLVHRVVSTGALGLLSSAVCRAAAAFARVASLEASRWSSMVKSSNNAVMDSVGSSFGSEEAPTGVRERIDPNAVEKEAAALCARIRAGDGPADDGDAMVDGSTVGINEAAVAPQVTVEALDAALRDVIPPVTALVRAAAIPTEAPPCLSIGAIGGIFSLNTLQMTAFSVLALALGKSMRRDLAESDIEMASGPEPAAPGSGAAADQLLFYLGGEGGTGKTRVIEAVSFFCRSWGRPRAVLNAAFTGLAASSIGGSTLHSLVQLSGKGRKTPASPNPQQCAAFRGTLMVVIDEVSMLSAEQLAETEGRLRLLMENEADFGGLHMCLGGDFFQMPPIGAPFLFVDSVAAHEAAVLKRRAAVLARVAAFRGTLPGGAAGVGASSDDAARDAISGGGDNLTLSRGSDQVNPHVLSSAGLIGEPQGDVRGEDGAAGDVHLSPRMQVQRRGFHLWRLFETVIVLTENVRQSEDKVYQEMVGAVRRGVWTDDCIAKLNTRLISERQADELPAEQTAVVVFTNVVRTWVTRMLLGGAARGMPRRVVRLFAVVRSGESFLSIAQQQALLHMPSQATGELEMLLDVYCGLPVLITKNLATELGVANGTRAVVDAVQFPEGTAFRDVVVDGGGVVLVPSAAAEIVWVKIDGVGALRPSRPCVPAGCGAGSFPIVMSKFRGRINLPADVGGRALTVQVEQFPVTPGFAMTPYKLQGRTLPMLCIPGWPTSRCPSCTAYLILSRPKKLDQLLLLQRVTPETVKKYGPGRALLAEDERLCAASRATARAWSRRLAHISAGGPAHKPDCSSAAVLRAASRPIAQLAEPVVISQRARNARAAAVLPDRQRGRTPGDATTCALSAAEYMHLAQVMGGDTSRSSMNEIVTHLPHVGGITRFDLVAFRPGGWLTSDGLYALFLLLQQRYDRRLTSGAASGNCFFLSPYFYAQVHGRGFDLDHHSCIPHQRGCDVFSQRAIFVPVHAASHWTLAVIYPADSRIVQYDSKGSHSEVVGTRLALWLEVEAQRCGHELRCRPSHVYMDGASPQQGLHNNDDCGFFVVHTARLLADGAPLAFDVSIMHRLRSRLAVDMLRGCIE